MNPKLRKSCIAAAMAALITSPVWAVEPGYPDPMQQSDPAQPMGSEPGYTNPDAAASRDNPLYSRTPDDLKREEVIDVSGEKVGTVKEVVAGYDRASAHVVISSGGFLGLGDTEIVVPLDELQPVGDKLQISDTKETLQQRREYMPEEYIELNPDRPISEFSAFEAAPGTGAPATSPGETWQ